MTALAHSAATEAETEVELTPEEQMRLRKAELDEIEELFGDVDLEEQPWEAGALCAQTDPNAFFPEKGFSSKEAKAICGACPVQEECLAYALENKIRFGIWGGLSERERKRLDSEADDDTDEEADL